MYGDEDYEPSFGGRLWMYFVWALSLVLFVLWLSAIFGSK